MFKKGKVMCFIMWNGFGCFINVSVIYLYMNGFEVCCDGIKFSVYRFCIGDIDLNKFSVDFSCGFFI